MKSLKDAPVRLDFNCPVFQRNLFDLEKPEQIAVLNTLRKIDGLTWNQFYSDRGLKWELIYSRTGPHGERLYSFRIGQKYRALAYREGEWLRILSLHLDHDSIYE